MSDPSPAWTTFADLLDPQPNPFVLDPYGWVGERLREFWWSGQREIAEMVVANRYSAIKASHDVSKSHTVSRLALWWIDVHPPGEAFVVTTAPTTPQVEAILWRYMGNAHKKAGLPGRITLDAKWYIGNELVAYGRKPADYDPAAFQGIHARYVLVIIDEAGGVPKSIFDAVDALATNVEARVVAVGNPDDPGSHFAVVCKPGSGWAVKKISAFDTPAWTGEDVPAELLPLLVSPEWVEERKRRWGVTSPIYQSKVLGEFPDISDDSLILPKWIEAAQRRSLERTWKPKLGVDVARFGDDETVIMRREGGWARVLRAHSKSDTMVTTGHVAKAMMEINAETNIQEWVTGVVDEDGVGGGVLDRLQEQGYEVIGFRSGASPTDKDRFINAKSEMLWMLREIFENGEIDIDPDDDQLAAQLGSIKWTVDSRGRIKIESKDEMKKRGLPSPDRAEALGMTLMSVEAGNVDIDSHSGGDVTGDLLKTRW